MKTVLVALFVLALAACSQTPQSPQSGSSATPSTGNTSSTATAARQKQAATGHTPTGNSATLLTQYHWQLTAASNKSGQRIKALFARPDKPLQLDFTAHSLAISNACNHMQANYSVAGSDMKVSRFATTLMACHNPRLMALDKAASAYLSGLLAFQFDTGDATPRLTLTTLQGDKLVFTGTPTAETRFGAKGETLFLEVAAQTKPCSNPDVQDGQCLYVRQLHYASNGVRAGHPGMWHILGHAIEGYTHKTGIRNVLRVKRYKPANPPANASSVAYVLDMVVESGSGPHK